MSRHDPTSGPGWSEAQAAADRVVDDPLVREAGPRGVEPWQITPGAPPVRRARPPRARTLLRDSTIHRSILKKSRITPVPAPNGRRREAETARKPEGHEREFYKPPAPLLTNVVVDRPPPVRKAADITWDPAPERVVAPDHVVAPELPPPLEPDAELDHAWFLSAEGTLEPAVERVTLPPRRIAAFLGIGVAIGTVALVAVAIGEGTAGSTASAEPPSVEAILGAPEPAPIVEIVEPAGTDEATAEPVVETKPDAKPEGKVRPHGRRSSPAIERLRTSMAENPVVVPEPAAVPPKTPEGSAELWGDIEKTEAPAGIWGEIDQ